MGVSLEAETVTSTLRVALGMSVNEEVEKETTGGLAGKAKSLE